MKTIKLVAVALLLSAGAYAQSQSATPPTATRMGTHQGHKDRTPEQRAALKAERKAAFANMTPDERKAVKQTHHAQREARLAAMPADKRAKIMARHQTRKVQRKQEKGR